MLPLLFKHPEAFKGYIPVTPVGTQQYSDDHYETVKVRHEVWPDHWPAKTDFNFLKPQVGSILIQYNRLLVEAGVGVARGFTSIETC